jgi:hypothetical protein
MPNRTKFARALRSFATFLGSSQAPGAQFWASKLLNAQLTFAGRPVRLATEVLRFYGGMGSLNDVVFGPGRDREAYDQLGDELYAQAQSTIRRDRKRRAV